MDARIIINLIMVLTIFHSACVLVAGGKLLSSDSDSIRDTNAVEWILTTSLEVQSTQNYSECAVVGGNEGNIGNPLWVIRAKFKSELLPGKLVVNRGEAYVPWDGKEHKVTQFEVLCARNESYSWVASSNGRVPPDAIQGGYTTYKEPLYIGRAMAVKSLTPGKVHPSHKLIYLPHDGQELSERFYEVLCKKN